MRTLNDEWDRYKASVLQDPRNSDGIMLASQMGFMAGAAAMLGCVQQWSGADPKVALAGVTRLQEEIQRFKQLLEMQRAEAGPTQ